MLFSLLTYVFYEEFDFGIIFEIGSIIFLLIARKYMSEYDEISSKRYVVCSIASIGWILIYDLVCIVLSIQNVAELVLLFYDYLFGQLFVLLYLAMLFVINRNLAKADNPIKYKESTDWFYERYEGKKEE